MESHKFYNSIANKYADISNNKAPYLNGIDTLVLNEIKQYGKCSKFLDIGCGDGNRTKKLLKEINPESFTGVEESYDMARIAKQKLGKENVYEGGGMEFLKQNKGEFDVITLLWNTLGHVSKKKDRIILLKLIRDNLAKGGICFLDVNNRYNVLNYGLKNVIFNVVKDLLKIKGSGYYPLGATGDGNVHYVYIFKPDDIDLILKEVDQFVVEKKWYVNYDNGKVENNLWKGQKLYMLKKI
jgi:SAM-dependent methyltransferase